MNDFNLKKALSGAKVITVGGDEVTQLTVMNVAGYDTLVGVHREEVLRWNADGVSEKGHGPTYLRLKMAPVMGDGFLYVFQDGCTRTRNSALLINDHMIMCFDLSKYPIGFGL